MAPSRGSTRHGATTSSHWSAMGGSGSSPRASSVAVRPYCSAGRSTPPMKWSVAGRSQRSDDQREPTYNRLLDGGMPERSKGARCKRAGTAYAGSNPAPPTPYLASTRAKLGRPAQLAQLVEHFHGKEGVAGSSPALGFRPPRVAARYGTSTSLWFGLSFWRSKACSTSSSGIFSTSILSSADAACAAIVA
jgi:hypothetical protein